MKNKQIEEKQAILFKHPIYHAIDSVDRLKVFMQAHVFAVWDFMSLAKRLQKEFTCLDLPWIPSRSPKIARFINEIVLYEETDFDMEKNPKSHFDMYLSAMQEIGADTSNILCFIEAIKNGDSVQHAFDAAETPCFVQQFVHATLEVALHGSVAEVVSYFLYGREDPIPQMFQALINKWDIDEQSIPCLLYYLKRHIQLDGDEHGPLAQEMLQSVITRDSVPEHVIIDSATQSIQSRIDFWDHVLSKMQAL